jgi:flagellar hook protein FlgE
LGIPLNVRLTTVKEVETSDSRTYRWYATSEDNEPSSGVDTVLGNGTITFDSNGRIISGDTTTVAVDRLITGSESPLEFTLDFSQISGLDVRNNLGQPVSTVSMTRQDGFPPGTLTSFIITESGLIRGVFSNGTERPLGQMRMARFANNTGLQQLGDNVFTKGVNSGEPIEGDPGDSGLGALTAGAVELSNTDIGQNLIELILASTQYRGGTRVITAAQQLLDELLSLRR